MQAKRAWPNLRYHLYGRNPKPNGHAPFNGAFARTLYSADPPHFLRVTPYSVKTPFPSTSFGQHAAIMAYCCWIAVLVSSGLTGLPKADSVSKRRCFLDITRVLKLIPSTERHIWRLDFLPPGSGTYRKHQSGFFPSVTRVPASWWSFLVWSS